MSDIVEGRIIEWREDGRVLIEAALPNLDRALKREYGRVLVELIDNRRLTDEQRKKAWACIGEIADWQGDQPPAVHWLMKLDFKVSQLKTLRRKVFSLSDCDMTTAREYITYLIDFMVRWGVPSKIPLYELCDDIQRYVYSCLINKRCAVCGKKSDLHHVDKVGMGRDRHDTCHIGMLALPLCRDHHTIGKDNIHQMTDQAFMEKYHIEPVEIDKEIAKVYKLGKKQAKE